MTDPEEDELAGGIFETPSYEAAEPLKKEFLPWHRPRKQFVRDKQWREQIVQMLDISSPDDSVLRYLGLPGSDLLDLRYFHEAICQPRGLKLMFLGFNTDLRSKSKQTELNISMDEVRRLPEVDPRSNVVEDDFAKIANQSSVAWDRASDLGPFDVVNLDLCNGFAFQNAADFADSHYNAVSHLMGLQARHKRPWLFLLTTRVGPDHVHESVRKIFLDNYLSNLTNCDGFRAASLEKFNVDDETSLTASAATESGFLPLILCSLCKWLAAMSLAQKPPTKIEVKSLIGYRVEGDSSIEDMVSIALKFTPVLGPVQDPSGLAATPAETPDECTAALQALNRVAARKNADQILAGDNALTGQMIEDSAKLLAAARYDPEEYRQWAAPTAA